MGLEETRPASSEERTLMMTTPDQACQNIRSSPPEHPIKASKTPNQGHQNTRSGSPDTPGHPHQRKASDRKNGPEFTTKRQSFDARPRSARR